MTFVDTDLFKGDVEFNFYNFLAYLTKLWFQIFYCLIFLIFKRQSLRKCIFHIKICPFVSVNLILINLFICQMIIPPGYLVL